MIGASGVGKTSLIDAGVVPALLASREPPLEADWTVARVRPGSGQSAWLGLARALNSALRADDHEALAKQLGSDLSAALGSVIDRLDAAAASGGARILLVLDHLESLLADASQASANEPVFEAIHEMVRTGRIWAVGGLRADYYQECARSRALTALRRNRGQYDLAAPDAEQIGKIIRTPAAAAGLRFETSTETEVPLDDHLQALAIAQTDVLPLLQFTLAELYERRDGNCLTYRAFADIGGLAQSMARRAEAIVTALDPEARGQLQVLLSAMVRVAHGEGRRYSRRYAVVADLIDSPARKRLMDALVDGRLLVTTLIDEQAVVSVTHESLFRHWDRARAILDDNHELLAFSRRLSDASSTWEEHARSEHYLLGAGPLDESERLLSSGAVPVAAREIDLIRASRKRASRSTVVRRVAIAGLATLAVVAVVAATMAGNQRREALLEAERANQTTEFLVGLFELANPGTGGGSDLSARQILDIGVHRLSTELSRQPRARSTLLHSLGSVYLNLGSYDNAEPLLAEALQIRRSSNAEIVDIARTLNAIGKLHYFRGDYDAASHYYAEAMTVLSETRDTEAATYATTLNNQGEVAAALADYDAAIDAHQEALGIRQEVFGPASAEAGSSLQNLAGVLRRSGRASEAEPLYRLALSVHEEAYGPSHPEVAVVLGNLGLLLTDAERFDEAEPLLERALDIRRDVFGHEHVQTANSLHNLSALLFRKKDYARAEPCCAIRWLCTRSCSERITTRWPTVVTILQPCCSTPAR